MSEEDIQRYSETEEFRKEVEALAAMPDDQIDFSDIPELTEADFRRMVPGRMLMYRPLKKPVTMRLDVDVLEWLKSTGPGYQSLANRLLRYQMCLALTHRKRHENRPRKSVATNCSGVKKSANGKSRRRA